MTNGTTRTAPAAEDTATNAAPDGGFTVTAEEAAELERVLAQLNESAERMAQGLERIHLLLRDTVRELRAARGAAAPDHDEAAAATHAA